MSELLAKKRALNKQKQFKYMKKVRDAGSLQLQVDMLRLQIRNRLKDVMPARYIDFKLMEIGKPIREQPSPDMDQPTRKRFMHMARIKYKRALYDWVLLEKERLEKMTQNIENAQADLYCGLALDE